MAINGSGNGEHNGNGKVVEKIVNNSWAILLARYILPTLITVIGYLAANSFADLKESIRETHTMIQQLDYKVNTTLADFDRRINRLETQPKNSQLQSTH